ncbi:MAG: hypothetical protein ABEH66_06780 [Halobacteriales archaeon]
MSGGLSDVTSTLRWIALGDDEPRLRATWRLLLALPLLPLVGLLLGIVMGVLGLTGMIAGGPIQAVIFLILLGVWAWAIDRRPLADYGVSLTPGWVATLLVGFGAVIVAHLLWYGLGLAGGWTTIGLSMTAPQDSLVVGAVGTAVSFVFNVWVQDTVYFAIVLVTAAQGFRSRDLVPRRAAIGALVVAILFFTFIHGLSGPVELADKLLAGAVFGLVYLYTGELALTMGIHGGISATGTVLFPVSAMAEGGPSVFTVTEALPGLIGMVSARRMPQLVIIFVLLVGYLKWRQDEVRIDTSLTQWTPREVDGTGTQGTK